MMAPFKISSRKERLCSGAKSMGNGRVEQTRRIKGGGTMRKTSTRLRGENFLPSKNFTPDFSAQSEQQAAAEFSAVIIDFSAGQLARASGRSKDTAECWKAGRTFPNGVSLLALAQQIPIVNEWVKRKLGWDFDAPQKLSMAFAQLERVLASDTAEGRAMRARVQQLAGKGEP